MDHEINIVGEDKRLLEIIETAKKAARNSKMTVLIRGESGTGKELIARLIHKYGRPEQPFVDVNCSTIPENLLEAELFGYERGAFTDAKIQKNGLFELAHGGILFMDEIGTMSLKLQSKILRAIEEKRFMRIGGSEEIRVTVRILAATNIDLEKAVNEGTFREDLYYRLNVISLHLPPLRERGEDVLLLADHFLDQFNSEYERDIEGFSKGAKGLLRSYSWPGNVRELKNAIEKGVFLAGEKLLKPQNFDIDRRIKDRRSQVPRPPMEISPWGDVTFNIPPWGLPLADVERKLIEETLNMCHWNVSEAARFLRITRDRLRYRMKRYGLDKTTSNSTEPVEELSNTPQY
ncbi:MAG: sigma-54-dependent Fis family transcriptional regulator [Gemmatimonadota bacterium]|nr:MAG: sigma-54-dependent Fis family transcriptional regulator [Gemmatimonadota bacterium]